MDLFEFLDGASPWWWVALAFALGAIEILTFSFFLIWPAIAALIVALVLWLVPDLSGVVQALTFALAAVVLTVLGRQIVLSKKSSTDADRLNNRAAVMIGRKIKLTQAAEPGIATSIDVDGIRWRARVGKEHRAVQEGQIVTVTGVDGMTLLIEPS